LENKKGASLPRRNRKMEPFVLAVGCVRDWLGDGRTQNPLILSSATQSRGRASRAYRCFHAVRPSVKLRKSHSFSDSFDKISLIFRQFCWSLLSPWRSPALAYFCYRFHTPLHSHSSIRRTRQEFCGLWCRK
jgi:hypothetical protein